MGSKRSPNEIILICDLYFNADDPGSFVLKFRICPLATWKDLKTEFVLECPKKPARILLKSRCFDVLAASNGCLLQKAKWKHLLCLSNWEVCSDGIFEGHWMRNKGNLCINFMSGGDLRSCIGKVLNLHISFKALFILAHKGGCFNGAELESSLKTFSRTIYGPPCRAQEPRFQMLSPMFSKLVVSDVDKLSPTPERTNARHLKRFVPGDQDRKLVQTPRSLMFAVLGWSGNSPTVTIEAYDPMARKWFYVSQDGFIKRAYHGVVMLGILIYVIGGFDGRMCFNSVFCFNVEIRRWYRRSSLHVPRCYVTALGCRGGVYALGGFDGDERFRSCERFDPRTRKWSYFTSMNDRRSDASGTVHKGKIYMCGGFNGTQVLTSTEIYDPDHDQWTLVADMLSPRSGHVLASYKGILLVIGGFDGEKRLREVERFDDVEGRWVQYVPMFSPRSNFAAAILEDKLHVIGGYNGYNTFAKVERFDDISTQWQCVRSLSKHRSAHGACVFHDSMVVSMCSVTGHITVRTVNVEQSSP